MGAMYLGVMCVLYLDCFLTCWLVYQAFHGASSLSIFLLYYILTYYYADCGAPERYNCTTTTMYVSLDFKLRFLWLISLKVVSERQRGHEGLRSGGLGSRHGAPRADHAQPVHLLGHQLLQPGLPASSGAVCSSFSATISCSLIYLS